MHSIALQIPKTAAHRRRQRADRPDAAALGDRRVDDREPRQRVHFNHDGHHDGTTPRTSDRGRRCRGSATRCSTRCSFRWSARTTGTSDSPTNDSEYADGVLHPELAEAAADPLPGRVPEPRSARNSGKPRADLAAILLTGIPLGVVSPDFQNFTGPTLADLLRLNMAIPPAATPSNLGVVGGDLAGFPNGRRIADDVVTIELKAIAGATYPLIDPTFTPDAAVGIVDQGLTSSATDQTAKGHRELPPRASRTSVRRTAATTCRRHEHTRTPHPHAHARARTRARAAAERAGHGRARHRRRRRRARRAHARGAVAASRSRSPVGARRHGVRAHGGARTPAPRGLGVRGRVRRPSTKATTRCSTLDGTADPRRHDPVGAGHRSQPGRLTLRQPTGSGVYSYLQVGRLTA